jgi:hypothetical protein
VSCLKGGIVKRRLTIIAIVAGALMLLTFIGSGAITHLSGAEAAKPQCMNGFDDDSDGRIDYPADSGCASRRDKTEYDDVGSPPPLPPPPPTPGATSWNPYVNRTPVITTIPFIIGNQVGSCGGASEEGGGFPNYLDGTEGLTPGQPIPSEIPSDMAFVQVNGVRLESTNRKLWGVGDGDATTNSSDPDRTDISNIFMKGIHLELSRRWGTIRLSDGTIQGPFLDPYPGQTVWPAPGTLVDVQGFVRWDALHDTSTGHYCSGWEIHPVSAWRLHQ